MDRKKIEPNKIIDVVRVIEPEMNEELFSYENGEFYRLYERGDTDE